MTGVERRGEHSDIWMRVHRPGTCNFGSSLRISHAAMPHQPSPYSTLVWRSCVLRTDLLLSKHAHLTRDQSDESENKQMALATPVTGTAMLMPDFETAVLRERT
jgi:hypothetical protein